MLSSQRTRGGFGCGEEMRGNLVNAEEDAAARPSTERLQEIQHGVSPAMQPRSMLHFVGSWLFGFIHCIWDVVGAVAACVPQVQVTEHEEATGGSDVEIHETLVNDESGAVNDGGRDIGDGVRVLEPRQKVFLSHSGAQKDFVEQLCVDLQRWDRYAFFDKLRSSLPIGERFPKRIFDAIEQCHVGVVVLSEEFFMSKWPMLELHAMVKKYKKSQMIIIPVFYLISIDDLKDSKKRKRWISKWKELVALDKCIQVEEWIECLRILESINGLVMKEGMGDVKFREEIVNEVCGKVPSETRWDDSHVHGRLRSCEVIQAKMVEVGKTSRVSVVGLYGVGGIGKTTICKALCNELSPKFGDFVCHIELGNGSELGMLQKALKKLTNMENDVVDKLDDVGEGYAYLNQRLGTQRVFLALDNVQDNYNSLRMASSFLRAKYGLGSVVLVCARSLDVLKMVYLNGSECLEMPELEEDEARSLFLEFTNVSARGHDVDETLVKHCLWRCHFLKSDGENRHYHPLALKVLGEQFGWDFRLWEAQLMKIDTFNQLGDMEHPVFCIFKNSYDSLNREQQLVFMDLALMPSDEVNEIDSIRILCLLNQERMEDMMDMLEVLKRKSMLDDISDDFTRIGMHDLWREFAVVETKSHGIRDQRWVYQVDERRGALGRRGLCRESVERMYFRNWGWKGLEGLKLDDFVNVTALRLDVEISMVDEKLDLDLSGLKQLKLLEVDCRGLAVVCNGLSSLRGLFHLLWWSPGISPCFNEIGCLTNLQYLGLSDVKGVEVLDFTGLDLLRLVGLINLPDLVTVRGFSSRLANLKFLSIGSCMSLQECFGLGEVYSLALITVNDCGVLTVIPDLGRLSSLRIFNIDGCKSLSAVPGLGGLISLEVFSARGCENLVSVPDIGRLTKLQKLNTVLCPMQGLPGLDGLISLTELCSSFGGIAGEQPLFSNLSALKVAFIIGWNGCNLWTSIQNLPMLETLSLEDCRGDDVVPDLQNLNRLKQVIIIKCDVKYLSGLSNATELEVLHVFRCDGLERLPEFERPSKLTELRIDGCKNLGDWPSASNLCSLVSLKVDSVSLTKIMPNLEKLTSLQDLMLCGEGCENVLSMAFLSQLETLEVDGSPRMQSLDLSNYLRLRVLVLLGCSGLERVTCRTPLGALVDVDVRRCERLVELPDLSMFPGLEEVTVRNCSALKGLTCSRPLTALEDMTLMGCDSLLGESIDMIKFPKLLRFRLVDSDTIESETVMTVYEEEQRQFRRFPARSVTLGRYGVYERK